MKKGIISLTVVMVMLGLWIIVVVGQFNPNIYLPIVMVPQLTQTPTQTPTPTVEPTATQTPGNENLQCETEKLTTLCAWVANSAPSSNSFVTIFGQLTVGDAGLANRTMTATWHYKTSTDTCTATSGISGAASCFRNIGSAESGYQVKVDVSMGGMLVTTWFTPQ